MKYSEFEKQVRDKLGSQEISLDTAALYNQINPQKDKKRFGALIIYLPMALIIGAVLAYFSFSSNDKSKGINHETSFKEQFSNENNGKAYHTSLTDNSIAKSSENEAKSSYLEKDENRSEYKTDINNFQTNNNHQSLNSSNSNTSLGTSRNQTIIDSKQDLNSIKKTLLPANTILQNDNTINENKNSINTANENSLVSLNSNDAPNTSLLDLETDELSTSNSVFSNIREKTAINHLNQLLLGVLETPKAQLNINKIECPDFRENKKWFDIELLAEVGYFYPMKEFSTPSSMPNEVDLLRSANEVSKEGFHAGIYAKFIGRKIPIYIQAGISQDFLTERMNLRYSYIERDTTQGIISITKSESGDTITAIIGDIITESEVSGNKKKHYRLQTIDIPLTMGYAFNFNRFTLGIEGGVLFNVSMISRGSILTEATDFSSIENQVPFKRNVGLSYLGGISLGYHLTPRSRIYLNTKLRVIPGEVNDGANRLTQKYNFIGANIGYGYLF